MTSPVTVLDSVAALVELRRRQRLEIVIPGPPVAQGRPRAFRRGAGVALVDPSKSRNWKAYASGIYQQALAAAGLPVPFVPVGKWAGVDVLAVFPLASSQHLKRNPRPSRPHTGRPDVDNLLKACLDAGNGLLWVDDSQVALAQVRKIVGEQGMAPHVRLSIQIEGRPWP